MSVSRFFNPQRGQYISQFVPEELPTDLMLGALQQKQKQYDLVDQSIQTELGDWNQRSLAGYDTKYTKEWKQKHENFVNESMGKDFTSPEFQRQYRDYMKKFKSDEGLKKVQSAVDKHDAFLLRYNALKQDKDTYAYAEELANEYNARYNKYTAENGLGFTGDIQLGDENIRTGNDVDALAKKLWDDINASGGQAVKQFENFSYKTGYEGVSQNTLDAQTDKMLTHFIEGPGGNQLIERYNQKLFGTEVPSIQLQNMTKEEKEKYNVNAKNYVLDYLREASSEFKYGKTTTDLDQAKNSQGALERSIVQQPNIEIDGLPTQRDEASYDEMFVSKDGKLSLFGEIQNTVKKSQHNINLYKGVIDAVNSGKPINFTPEQKLMLQGLPGGDQVLAGGVVSGDVKNQLINALDKSQTAEIFKLNSSKTREKELKDRYATAVDISTNNKEYNGMTFKNAVKVQEELENDPSMNKVIALYETMKKENPSNAFKILYSTVATLDKNIKEGKGAHTSKQLVSKVTKYINAIQSQTDYFNEMSRSDNPEKAKQFKETYNNLSREQTPKAQPAQMNDYTQFDEVTGKIKGKAIPVDRKMQETMQNDLSQFTVIDADTGEEIKPTIQIDGVQKPNPKYPNPKTLTLSSVDKEIINDLKDGIKTGTKISMNVTGLEGTMEAVLVNGFKDPKLKVNQQQKRYKVVASGLTSKSYTDAKYRENMSNYYANPNTETGKQSYIDAQMFKDFEYGKELAKVASLSNPGQKSIMTVNMHSPDLLKEVPYTIEVVKSNLNDGQLIAVVKDYKDNVVSEPQKFANIQEFNNYVKQRQEASKQNVQNAKDLGYSGNVAEINVDRVDEENVIKTLYDIKEQSLNEALNTGKILPIKITNTEGQVKVKYRTKKEQEDAEKSSKDFEKTQNNLIRRR